MMETTVFLKASKCFFISSVHYSLHFVLLFFIGVTYGEYYY